jgi:type VI protein secretion system component Hcp
VTPPTQNGKPGVPQTGEFDVTGAATDALANAISTDAVTTTQVSLASAATAVPANSPLQYLIKVDGATGDSTLKGFEGWFSVDGFDWGVQNSRTTSTGTGGGAGKTTFSPLTVDVHSLSGLAALFSDAARGQNLGTVELAAVDTIKGQTLKVYDIKLSDVFVGGFENDPGQNGVETALSLDFSKIHVTVQPQTADGPLGVPQTADFDVAGAATDAVARDVASTVTTTQVSLASAATPVPANSPLQYFIKVDGATGDSTLKGFEGWFSVDGFDWGAQNSTSIGSAGSGAGAGKTTFSPLTVDIHSLSGLATLFSDAAGGANLDKVEFAAVDTVRGQALKVYDIKLSDVFVSGFENDPGPNGVETAVQFDFAKISVTVTPPTQNGRPGVPQTSNAGLTTGNADLSPSDLLFDAAANGPAALQAALLAPGSTVSLTPDDLAWHPTLSTHG